jgi:hypothetical protein
VQRLIREYPPDRLYRYKPTGQRGWIVAYAENDTVRMEFPFGLNWSGVQVFGIPPEGLEWCDDPDPIFPKKADKPFRLHVNDGSAQQGMPTSPPETAAAKTTEATGPE